MNWHKPTNEMENIPGQRIHTVNEEEITTHVALMVSCCIYLILEHWPTYQGPTSLYLLPLDYKRESTCDTWEDPHSNSLGDIPIQTNLSQALSNTIHSGAGYYAPAAQTTLNPCVL